MADMEANYLKHGSVSNSGTELRSVLAMNTRRIERELPQASILPGSSLLMVVDGNSK